MQFLVPYKKTFAIIGILAILVPSLFLAKPQEVKALVPVYDAASVALLADIAANTTISAQADSALELKEFVLDLILWALVKAIIHSMVQSMVSWIQTGDFGNPLWVTDVKRWFLEEADRMSGIFLEKYLDPAVYDLLCNPFKLDVFIAISRDRNNIIYPDRFEPKCTLLSVIDNVGGMADFMGDFRLGGWEAWFSMISEPTNNPAGAYLSALSAMEETVARAEDRADTESQMNQGFRGAKICLKDSPFGGFCEEWGIDSPGKWVENEIGMYTTSEIRTLEIADEIDELLGALAGMLMDWVFSGLGGGLGSTAPGPGPMPDPPPPPQTINSLLQLVDDSILSENNYINTINNAFSTLNQATNILISEKNCLQSYLNQLNACTLAGGTILAGASVSQVNGHISTIDTKINNVNNQKTTFNSETASANAMIVELQNLRTLISTATTISEIDSLTTEFLALRTDVHNAIDENNINHTALTVLSDANLTKGTCSKLKPINCFIP